MNARLLVSATCLALATATAQVATDFRIVNGQLYNIQKSKLWQDIPPPTARYSANHSTWYSAKIEAVRKSEIYVRITATTDRGVGFLDDDWVDRLIVIRNHPKQQVFTVGDVLPHDKFFPMGGVTVTNSDQSTVVLKAFDYGFPNTPENRKNVTNNPSLSRPKAST